MSESRVAKTDGIEMSELKVWHNGYEWVIAKTVDEAIAITLKSLGSDDPEDVNGDGWYEWPSDKQITIHSDDEDYPPKETKTAREWVETQGEGFLCSTEW